MRAWLRALDAEDFVFGLIIGGIAGAAIGFAGLGMLVAWASDNTCCCSCSFPIRASRLVVSAGSIARSPVGAGGFERGVAPVPAGGHASLFRTYSIA